MSAVFNFPSGILLWSAASSRNLFSQTGTCLAALHPFCFPLNCHKPVLMSLSQPPPHHICLCLCNLSLIISWLCFETHNWFWEVKRTPVWTKKKKWYRLVSWPCSCSCLVWFLCLFHDKHLHLLEFVHFCSSLYHFFFFVSFVTFFSFLSTGLKFLCVGCS